MMLGVVLLVVWLVLLAVGVTLSVGWLRRAWAQRQGPLPLLLALLLAAGTALGVAGTGAGVAIAFGHRGGKPIDPSQKARLLAEGISEAMNCTALGLLVAVPSAIVLAVVTRRKRRLPAQ